MGRSEIRDYVYVSRLKVQRLSETIAPSRRFKLRQIQLGLGGLSGSVEVNPQNQSVSIVSAIPAIESAIDERYGVRHFLDESIASGHWFMADGLMMNCQVNQRYDCVIFFGEESGTRVILGGSSVHMLDRLPTRIVSNRTEGNSTYSGLVRALAGIYEEQKKNDENAMNDMNEKSLSFARDEGDAIELARSINESGRVDAIEFYSSLLWDEYEIPNLVEPLSFLGRAFHVFEFEDMRYILGTPLYVANEPPQ